MELKETCGQEYDPSCWLTKATRTNDKGEEGEAGYLPVRLRVSSL